MSELAGMQIMGRGDCVERFFGGEMFRGNVRIPNAGLQVCMQQL